MAITAEHQIYTELFADSPDLAVGFLRRLGADVPEYERSELASCDLGHADPVERRADITVMLRGPGDPGTGTPLMGIVVEVQRGPKKRKRFTWPEYLTALRSKHECPVSVLALCPRQSVADYYAEPVPTGHPGFVFQPLVVGPADIPLVTDAREVEKRPTLGVLSAAAHGARDKAALKALHAGLSTIDVERATKYIGFTLNLLSGSGGEQALEELMKTADFEYTSAWTESLKSEGVLEGRREGRQEGTLLARADDLLDVLTLRGIDLSPTNRTRLEQCDDLEQLTRWFRAAVTADHENDVFDTPNT